MKFAIFELPGAKCYCFAMNAATPTARTLL